MRLVRAATFVLTMVLTSQAGAETFNAPAVKVDTQIVSIREVEIVFADSFKLLQDRLRAGALSQTDLLSEIRKAWTEALDQATQDNIIDQLADKERSDIIKSFVRRYGDEVSPAKVKEWLDRQINIEIRRLRQELVTAAGGEEELRAALKRRGQTMDEWERNLSRELFRREVLFMRLGPILTSPAQAKDYYEKHPDEFKQRDAWQLRRIRIPKGEIALEKAKMVRDKINSGADFADIAVKISDDPQYGKQGGLLTSGGKSELPSGAFPHEEQIASTLKDGELSQPIDAGDWYVIVQRVGYRPAKTQTFAEAEEKAESLSLREKLKAKKKELFDKLKRDTYIEVLQPDPPDRLLKLATGEGEVGAGR